MLRESWIRSAQCPDAEDPLNVREQSWNFGWTNYPPRDSEGHVLVDVIF